MPKIIFIIVCCMLVLTGFAQKKYPSSTWVPITIDCKVGYINPNGKVMIQPQFEHAWRFSDGLAFVWSYPGEKEQRSKIPLGEEYRSYELVKNSLTGIIDSTGTYIVQPKLNFRMIRPFQDGIAYVKIDDKVCIINKKGEQISYDDRQYDRQYRQILRVAKGSKANEASFINAYNYIVYDGFEGAEEFSGNFAAVKLGGKIGYINREGELVVVPQFTEGGNFVNGYATVVISYPDNSNREIKYYGVIDTLGNYVIAPTYTWLGEVSDGMVAFRDSKGNNYGYLDLNGNVAISPVYKDVRAFSEGLACVFPDDKCGYINKKGEMVIPVSYDYGSPFKAGVASVGLKGEGHGLINTSGKFTWGPVKYQKDCN